MEKTKKKKNIPWYVISLMLTVLGAISIVMLFIVYYYNETGIVFWSIIFSWLIILLIALMEIGRMEREQRDMRKLKDLRIAELEKALEEKQ